jgi:hypothetical protein
LRHRASARSVGGEGSALQILQVAPRLSRHLLVEDFHSIKSHRSCAVDAGGYLDPLLFKMPE